ncbi:MAG: sulfotransferase [Chthoniobacteraceae bacterium]
MSFDSNAFSSAGSELRAGRLREAAVLLHRVLASTPDHAESLEKLGIISFQLGDSATAQEMLRRAVSAHPENESAWNNLGVVLEAHGSFAEADDCYRRAIALNPQRGALHFNRGNTLRSLGRWAEAEASFRRCMAVDDAHAQARHNLGALLKERGERAEAERLFRETIALAPDMVDAHVNLGSALQALGRDEEALAAYREALRLAPGYADAAAGEVSVLDRLGRLEEACARIRPLMEASPENADVITTFASVARRLGEEEKAVAALERLLTRHDLLATKREAALFALGKLCDSRARFSDAFRYYRAANSVRSHPFDLAEFRGYCARIRETFSEKLLRRLPRARNDSAIPVFVVGMPRSGTSLVEQILSSHSAVFGAGELTWLDQLSEALPQRLATATCYPECALDLSVRSLDAAADEYLATRRTAAPNAERVVDKMPGNFMHLGLIEVLFPGSRIIHITREPLDNCLSCYFQNFTHGHEYTADLATLGSVYREYEQVMAHWRSTLTHALLEIRYETLVADQEKESRRLVEFCGLPWDERCLRFHETKRIVRTASYDQVRRPMYRDSVARYRHYEPFLGDLREALGASA